ncbi:signal peptidase I [uncultured Rikenella sp.]|uniref:signal peptidase I n=1 Tax=uncultured Rikenella sp. TaxID=368003 RepID=UPI0026368EC2|nr:signal peptidase I [uncultured Rikenella sp.]
MKKAIEKLRAIWGNKWVKFSIVSLIYILWFVVWTRNLWWLLGVAVIYDLYITRFIDRIWLNRYRAYKKGHKGFRHVMEWVEALLFAVIVVVPLKTYFFGMYVIPSSSMEQTLLVGDYIFVDKTYYGPKMPNTPLSFPFVQNTLPLTKTTPSYVDWIQWPYKRLAGRGAVKRDDVVVFNFPEGDTVALGTVTVADEYGRSMETDVSTTSYYDLVRMLGRDQVYDELEVRYRPVDKRENYIKRCVALAGDTIQVIDGDVYINGQAQRSIPGVQHLYMVHVTTPIGSKIFERLGVDREEIGYQAEAGRYTLPLTAEGVEVLQGLPEVTSVTRFINRIPNEAIFPHNTDLYPWTEDQFGPLWVPQAGVTVPLTVENLPLYERIIRNYEGNDLVVDEADSLIYINGSPAKDYTFQMDYYFMMGDNRHNSADSRFWGFVPVDHIEGKASFVWLSITPGKNIFTGVRWDRMFRRIQ